MGLTGIRKRIGFTILFLIAAVFAFSLGDHRHAKENARAPIFSIVEFFQSDRVRAELTRDLDQAIGPNRQRIITSLARRAPLDVLPYEAALVEAYRSGDDAKKDAFAQRVLSFQPRSLAAHLYLLEAAERSKNFTEVFEQYEDLMRLRSLNDGLLTEALIGVFREHGDWTDLVAYLETHPPGGEMMAARLLNEPISDQMLEPVVHAYPSARGQYLRNLTHANNLDRAYEMWSSFANLSDQEARDLPFNHRFADRTDSPPFNWNVVSTSSELQTSGGLYVTYFGKGFPLIAEQMIKAPTGDYLLRTEAKGRMPRDGGSLAWSVTCHEAETPLAELVIILRKTAEIEIFETEMNVPAENCDYQIIQLHGRAGEFPKTSRTEIVSVELLPQP